MSRRALLNEGAVVGGDVAMVAVFLQHVDLRLDLLLFLLRHIHHLDGGQLARLDVTALMKNMSESTLARPCFRKKHTELSVILIDNLC